MKSKASEKNILPSEPVEKADESKGPPARAHQVTAREGALLILHLIEKKSSESSGKPVTRCRISEMTIRRLFRREHISRGFLMKVQNWLFRAGWVLFFAGDSYALVKLRVVNGWIRIGSKRIAKDLRQAARGSFDFKDLEPLLLADEDEEADSEEE